MKNDSTVLTEKLQKLEKAKKNDNYEYLTGKEILPSDQSRKIEPVKFTYSPLGKLLEKQQQKQLKIKKGNTLEL